MTTRMLPPEPVDPLAGRTGLLQDLLADLSVADVVRFCRHADYEFNHLPHPRGRWSAAKRLSAGEQELVRRGQARESWRR